MWSVGNRAQLQSLRVQARLLCLRDSKEARGAGPPPKLHPSPFCLQENQGPALADSGSPKDSPAHEVAIGGRGAYTRFDVPRPRVKQSWPSFRGGGRAGPQAHGSDTGTPGPPTPLLHMGGVQAGSGLGAL